MYYISCKASCHVTARLELAGADGTDYMVPRVCVDDTLFLNVHLSGLLFSE